MNNLVSIIVPVYNSQKTIKKCLESILNQTYKNIEVILVNDGGSDDSEKIILSYNDERIVYINNEHGGVSRARNTGIVRAKGKYIQFVDSDDHIEPIMVEKMLATSLKYDADIVVCNYTHPSIKNYLGNKIVDLTNYDELLGYYQTTFAGVVPWNKLYKRDVIKTLYDEEVGFCEDDLFGLANMFNAKRLVGIDDVLYHYYVAPADTSIDEMSCINKLANAEDFYLTKKTYWYMRNNLKSKCENIINQVLPTNLGEDFIYTREFDFMLWELLILNQVGVNKEGLIIEMTNIFNEEDFIKAINIRQKYGVKLKKFTMSKLAKIVRDYVDTCYVIIDDINKNKLELRPFYVCLNLFTQMFMERCAKHINPIDIISKSYVDLLENKDPEATYVNELFKGKEVA